MTYFGTTDFDVELARGRITDMTEINKFGRNQDIDTTRDEKIYSPMPTYSEKTDLRISGIGSTNNFDVSAGFDLYIADN